MRMSPNARRDFVLTLFGMLAIELSAWIDLNAWGEHAASPLPLTASGGTRGVVLDAGGGKPMLAGADEPETARVTSTR